MSLFGILGAIVAVVGALGGVIYWIKGKVGNAVTLDETTAALRAREAQVAQIQAADRAAREQRLKEFDAKAAAVTDGAGAGELLRQITADDSGKP